MFLEVFWAVVSAHFVGFDAQLGEVAHCGLDRFALRGGEVAHLF